MSNRINDIEKRNLIIILAVAVLLSLLVAFLVANSSSEKLYNMQTGIEVKSEEEFVYAMETHHVSGIWGIGNVKMTPVYSDFLANPYGKIIEHKERYTEHSREVCTGEGDDEVCVTEYYYTWDSAGSKKLIANTLIFMGYEFPTKKVHVTDTNYLRITSDDVTSKYKRNIKYNKYIYDERTDCLFCGIETEGDVRYYFEIVPIEHTGVMYIRSTDSGFLNASGHQCGCEITKLTPQAQISIYEKQTEFFGTTFPICFPIVIFVICFGIFWYTD